jgi:phosphoglycolate phosphatase
VKKCFKLVIFDWDGTVMDSVPRIVFSMQTAANDVALPVPSEQQVKNIIGLSMHEAFDALFGEDKQSCKQEMAIAYTNYYLSKLAPEAAMFDGFHDLLNQLSAAGVLLGVATGKTRKGLDRVLQQSKSHEMFAATMSACDAKSKPDPEMLLKILQQLDVAAADAVMVGDSIHDINMAVQAGITGIGITHGAHNREDLLVAGAAATVDTLTELSALLVSS